MRFIKEKIKVTCDRLNAEMRIPVCPLDGWEYVECGYKKDNTPPADGWAPFVPGTRIGGKDRHWWFRLRFVTKPAHEGRKLYFNFQSGQDGWEAVNPQGLIYLNGSAVQSLDTKHRDVLLQPATEYDCLIYLYSSMKEDLFDFIASLVEVDEAVEKAYYDFSVPLAAVGCFDPDDEERSIRPLRVLDAAAGLLDFRRTYSPEYYAGLKAASDYMDKEFYHGICGKGDKVVGCIGHTHIDVAWLWTLAQTCEKAQRSFATVINLMKQFPEYKFMSSQPQLYLYVKENLPELYAEIKKAVAEGRWEVEGASWLEMDTNITSGESLVRQIMFGKRFMKEEFGVDSKIMWLPDVFGYSAALPQILKKCGVDRFMTTKIAWSETDKFPFDSFYWEGLDGSRVFAMFATTQDRPLKDPKGFNNACTYNAMLTPGQVLGTWERYQQKEYNNVTLMTFGYGDGGGGPTAEMLQMQRRLACGLPGLPRTEIDFAGNTISRAKANLDRSAAEIRELPVWVGELYLEMHRGTYTSIAKNKKNNRRSEQALAKAEFLGVADMLSGGDYPQEKLNECWQGVLLNQFHDIIPGSSIFEVYEDSDRHYAKILGAAGAMAFTACSGLESRIKTDGGLLVYSALPFETTGTVVCGGKTMTARAIPAHGWKVIRPEAPRGSVKLYKNGAENDFFTLLIDDKTGDILSLYDKRNHREVFLPDSRANKLTAYEDMPKNYDAWEITEYYKQKPYPVDGVTSVTGVADGARAGLVITRKFLDSTIKQTYWLYDDIDRIDIENDIDWKENHLLLRADFPVAVHTDRATYEVQFGSVERPTHRNTSWDQARFEVCGHKWADISDDGYGLSLLNDCKYGHSAEGSTLSLSLLKCATYPNPAADKHRHTFTYSLYPHAGGFRQADTVKQAYLLNQPLFETEIGAQDGSLPDCFSLVTCDLENVVVETVKKAEEGGDIVVRLYESHNRRCAPTLQFGFDFDEAYICDMLENEQTRLEKKGRAVTLPVGNFETVTLRLTNPRL